MMILFTLIVALLIEQVRPLDVTRWVRSPLQRVSRRLQALDREARDETGRVIWWSAVLGLTLMSGLVWLVLGWMHPLFAFAFNVLVLYLVLAHRRENRYFADVLLALSAGDVERGRTMLAAWTGTRDAQAYARASASELARLSIERMLLSAHRNLYGPIFWFVLLPGPVGAVMYRVAAYLAETSGQGGGDRSGGPPGLSAYARRSFVRIDWLPVRLTALAFSVIGNFEDAIYCWRAQSVLWPDKASGILIASGAGALGVRLGLPIHESGAVVDRPEMGLGGKADVGYMQAAATMVWRVMVLVLLLLALLGIASWVGH